MDKIALVVVNFGGPRNLEEVRNFLEDLLTDHDVIRTGLPFFIQDFLFKKIAKKRSEKIAKDYALIGGKSPIFEDTEWVAAALGELLNRPSVAFHRYIRKTHADFLEKLKGLDAEEIWVFPLFPQFSYATTGSIARWVSKHVPTSICKKMKWVESYPVHLSYVEAFVENIREFLLEKGLKEEETVLLFSAHGLPESFVQKGDPYQKECQASFQKIASYFPKAQSMLSYQSKFGRSKWIEPSTLEVCNKVSQWIGEKKQIVFLPLSFTSDHIETLFEVEQEYMKPLRDSGYAVYRCPALGRRKGWLDAMKVILNNSKKVRTCSLIRL